MITEAQSLVGLQLRDYQLEALAAIEEARGRGVTRQLVALPTGTGKTVVFACLIAEQGGNAIVLVHRDELIGQTVKKLEMVAPGLLVGIVKANRDEWGADVVIASTQTVTRAERIARRDFATVIIDECHHYAAETWRAVPDELRCFEPDGPLTVGFSATPERADGEALGDIFQEVVFERSLLDMIKAGYLSDLRAVQVKLAADFGRLHTRAGDFIDSEVEQLLFEANAPRHAVEAYEEHAKGRKALLFTPTVKIAEAMTDAFTDAGIAAATVSGAMPMDERRAVLGGFRDGAIQVVSNCAVLTEGFDQSDIGAVMIARPTRSRPLYIQMVGRGTRLHPGKQDCLIIDFADATTRHDLISIANLFPTKLQPGESVLEAEARGAAQVTPQADGELVSTEVDLFRRHRFAWVMTADGCYLLSIADGQLALIPDGVATFKVVLRHRDGSRQRLGERLSLEYAQGLAEDFIRKSKSAVLVDRSAPWRQRPASEKQIATLRKLRIPIAKGITAGAASDAITLTVSRFS